MRAELRDISPNDFSDWQGFASAEHPEPWDDIFEQLRLNMYWEYEKRWS